MQVFYVLFHPPFRFNRACRSANANLGIPWPRALWIVARTGPASHFNHRTRQSILAISIPEPRVPHPEPRVPHLTTQRYASLC